jgi:FkbM family methyltransferase
MLALRDLLKPERLTAIVDVGANPIDGHPPYRTMLEQGLCTVVGFEPLVEALGALNDRKGPNETYLPYIVGDGGEHTLHLTREQGMVSLLKPNATHLSLFERMGEFGHVEATMETTTVRLDDLAEVETCDLLKLDIQGAELSVIQNAPRHLSNAVAVLTEVSFVTLYENQPTLGQIDTELRSHGFIPHCFAGAKCWPICSDLKVPRPDPHQLLEADMVYVRDFTKPMAAEQWKQLAMIAHHVCASYDLAMLAVEMAAKMGAAPSDAPVTYRKTLEAA